MVLGNYRNTMFEAAAAGPEKHGISIQLRTWFTFVSRFDAKRSSGNYRNTMFEVTGSGPEKHGISVQLRTWFTLVSRFDAVHGSGELQKYHV